LEQLLSKLSNLSYEILGILLPGLVALILLCLWLVGVGDLMPYATQDFIHRVSISNASKTLESLGIRTGVGLIGPTLIATYFLGHLLHWISRKTVPVGDDSIKNDWKRTWYALRFKTMKPSYSYEASLSRLYDRLQLKFSTAGALEWAEFYPVAKSYLQRNLSTSLYPMYQNKYTLHRSVTAAAALVFWLCAATMVVGAVTIVAAGTGPRFVPLGLLAYGSLILVWGFSDSFTYNWKLFGNTVITETYSLLNGPADTKS